MEVNFQKAVLGNVLESALLAHLKTSTPYFKTEWDIVPTLKNLMDFLQSGEDEILLIHPYLKDNIIKEIADSEEKSSLRNAFISNTLMGCIEPGQYYSAFIPKDSLYIYQDGQFLQLSECESANWGYVCIVGNPRITLIKHPIPTDFIL
jgi:hypothetical protein